MGGSPENGLPPKLDKAGKALYNTKANAPVAQGIEHSPPKKKDITRQMIFKNLSFGSNGIVI